MIPKFLKGQKVNVLGDALYAEIIRPPRRFNDDYMIRLIYPLAEIRTRVYRSYAEEHWTVID